MPENGVEDHGEMEKLARMNSKDFNDSWSGTQHQTFKNWINSRLKDKSDWRVEDLSADLQDGCVLCRLLEILSSKSLGRYYSICYGCRWKTYGCCLLLT